MNSTLQYMSTDKNGVPWYMWLMQPNAMVTIIKEKKMDHIDLMFVRDAVVSRDEDDMNTAVDMLETELTKGESQDLAVDGYDSEAEENSEDG